MDTSLFYNSELEQAIKDTIDVIRKDNSNKNKDILIDLFKNKFSSNQATLYKMFQIGADGTSILSLEQQRILFDSLELKQRGALYNTIDVDARKRFYYSLSSSEAETFKRKMRSVGVDNAYFSEIALLDDGYCTRDWDIDQLREMYLFNNDGKLAADYVKPHEFSAFDDIEFTISIQGKNSKNPGKVNVNPKKIAGHHMMAVKDYPEFMADGNVIQFLDTAEHLQAHGGYDKNGTLAYFDGENYIGLKYNEPYINNKGEFVEGEFLGDGKMYQFVPDKGKIGHFEEIAVDSDTYNKLINKKFPPIKKSSIFPSVKEASYILGGKTAASYTAEELFNARLGIAEYRKLGVNIESVPNIQVADHLRNVGKKPSDYLSKTTITLDEEGKIAEVTLKLDDSADEIKLFKSSTESSGQKYSVTAAEYKKMNALPEDITNESIKIRYYTSGIDDLSPIEKLKLRKADAMFAEKSLYLSLNDFDEASRKGIVEQLLNIADDPDIANRAVFSFNENGNIVGFDLTGEIPAEHKGCFSAKFSELRNAPSDYDIMRNFKAFGYKNLESISSLDMHKLRAGVAMYEKVGVDKLDNLLQLTGSTENENGKIIRDHLMTIADDPDSLLDTKYFFDKEGKLVGIGTQKPTSDVFEMKIAEVKRIPTDDTMRNMLNGYDDIKDAAEKFALKHAITNGDTDEFVRILAENIPDNAEGIGTLIKKANNDLSSATVLLEGTKGDYERAIEIVTRSNDDVKGAIAALNSTGNDVDDTLRMLKNTGGDTDAIVSLASHSNNFKTAEKLFEFTGQKTNDTIKLLDSLKGNSDDALRLAERVGKNNIDDIIKIVNKAEGQNIEDIIKLADSLKGDSSKMLKILDASKGDSVAALRVLKNTDSIDDAVRIFNDFGGELSDSFLKQKYKFLNKEPDLLDLYRGIEYRIQLGADPTKFLVGDVIKRTNIKFAEENWILFKDIKDLCADDFIKYAMNEPCPSIGKNGFKNLERIRGELQLTSAMRKGFNVGVGVNTVTASLEIYNTVKFISSMADGLENGTLAARDVGKETTKYIANAVGGIVVPAAVATATMTFLGALAAPPLFIGIAAVALSFAIGLGQEYLINWIVDELYDPAYDSVWAYMDWVFVNVFDKKYHLIQGSEKDDKIDLSSGSINNGCVTYNVTNPADIAGGDGDDIIYGFIYNDILNGDNGNDTINGNSGDDEIYGGDGNDILQGDLGNDTIKGGSGVDWIYGDNGIDKLNGEDDDDYIWGGDGNDIIHGNNGSDHMYGENGDDQIFGDNGNDYIEGGIGCDTIYGGNGEDYIDGGDDDDYIEGGKNIDVINGGTGADIIYGETKENRFSKTGSDDYIIGGSGKDRIYGCAGDDYIWGNMDNDMIEGGHGDDIIDGGLGDDEIFGNEGNDTLTGDSGDDAIYGGYGEDTINGGYGNDILYGMDGDDTYIFDKDIYGSASNRGNVDDHDVVYDPYGENTVLFGSTPANLDAFYNIIRFEKKNNGHDLLVSSKQTGASMLIEYFFYNNNFTFKFAGDSYNTFILNNDLKLEKVERNDDWFGSDSGSSSSFIGSLIDKLQIIAYYDFKDASSVQPPRDPLIIDIDGNGVKTTDVVNGVHFDIDNNGFAELTSWVEGMDGLLVYNRDKDPRITNGSELFSDQVYLPDGTRLKDGFAVLKTFDKNDDDVISGDEFSGMQVWIDKNHDGKTYIFAEGEVHNPEKQELYSIDELGIVSISTKFTIPEEKKDKPNQTLYADVTFKDRHSTISEHWFNVDTSNTLELNTNSIDNNLTSFGNLHSISYTIENESDGYVKELLDLFNKSGDYIEKRMIVKKILYRISGADMIDKDSRGTNIDARDLHVLEMIMGVEKFVGAGNSINPNSNAAAVLKNLSNKFEELYFNILNRDSNASGFLDLICEIVNDGNTVLNIDHINNVLDDVLQSDNNANDIIYSICSYLKMYDYAHDTQYLAQFAESHKGMEELIARYGDIEFILGSNENDIFNGTNANELFYGDHGDDTISCGAGNDIIDGGAGNDILYGGYGDDTYVFNLGDGQDIMREDSTNSKDDRIVFGEGITPDDITVSRDGDDMLLFIGENGDNIRIIKQFTDSWFRIEKYEFADSETVLTAEDLLNTPIEYNNVVDGVLEDYDSGYGTRDAKLVGTDDAETILGRSGNDILIGGKGNDILYGGYGDDTYVFNLGDGQDIMREDSTNSKDDRIVFGEGITPDDITVSRDGDDMLLFIGENGDNIRIIKQFTDSWFRIEKFEFEDGTIAHIDLSTSRFVIDVEGKTESIEQLSAELLESLYEEDAVMSNLLTEESTVITDVTESTVLTDESDNISDMTDIQAMLLAENMSAFGNDDQISDNMNIADITADTSLTDSLFVGSLQ